MELHYDNGNVSLTELKKNVWNIGSLVVNLRGVFCKSPTKSNMEICYSNGIIYITFQQEVL